MADVKQQIQSHLREILKTAFDDTTSVPVIELEIPADKSHGDLSTSIALKSAKLLKKSPLIIAQDFCKRIDESLGQSALKTKIQKVEVKAPGFINFFLTPAAVYEVLQEILQKREEYGRLTLGVGQKVQIEFVSANPTGPLSVAHARQAAVGDALGNILKFMGFDVTKEYYVNDEGNQINLLGESLTIRAREILSGESLQNLMGADHYKGEYIKDIAQKFINDKKIKSVTDLESVKGQASQYTVDYLMEVIKAELEDFGVHFDVWSYQSKIAAPAQIEKVLEDLKKKNFLYEKEGALWFNTTQFKDDKDRVVKKSDGSYTYLSPDIVYHKHKFERGFKRVINIWGPDHHGYIQRLKASVAALGYNPDDLIVLIVQLASIYRQGQPVSMSTRAGQYISLREVMEEVGVDVARFFYLMRHIDAHLEFDLELAKKQSPENPVYYIQYAHARIHSINKKAKELQLGAPIVNNFSLLKESEELELIKKLGNFSQVLIFCHEKLDPYPMVAYMQELATSFHYFYDKCRVLSEDKNLSNERLSLVNAVRIVLANGLRLLGVSTPEIM